MSWPVHSLKDVCNIDMGSAPKGTSYVELAKGIPLIAGAADYGDITPNPKKATIEPTRLTQKGDIIICVRATIGDLNWADKQYCLGRGVAGLRVDKQLLDSKYLWYFIRSYEKELYRRATGSTFPQINRTVIESIQIPLPPLSTQKQIATILEKADQLRKDCQQMERELNNFAQAVFIDMFGDPVSNPKGWDVKPLKDVSKIVTGNTPPREKLEFYGSHVEWIKSDNINTPSHLLTKSKEYLSVQGAKVGRLAPAGAILMTCIAGSPECIGNVAMSDRTIAFNQQINAVIPKTNLLFSEFFYVLCLVAKKQIQSASTNSMKGMISKGKLEEVALPIPPIDLQEKFSLAFKSIIKIAENQRALSVESEGNFQALIKKAFSGELNLKNKAA